MSETTRSQAKRPIDLANQESQPSTSAACHPSCSTPVPETEKKIKISDSGSPGSPSQSTSVQPSRESIFGDIGTVKMFGRIASLTDLAKLKAVNMEYYRVLKPIQFKNTEQKISIEEYDIFHPFPEPLKTGQIKISTTVGQEEKLINALNWKSELAEIFKLLEFSSMFFFNDQSSSVRNTRFQANYGLLFISSLLEQLYPYATTVDVRKVYPPVNLAQPGVRYAEFWNQFTNLKQLKLVYENRISLFSTYQLDMMLQTLRPDIQVHLNIRRLLDITNMSTLIRTVELHPDKVKIKFEFALIVNHQQLEEVALLLRDHSRSQLEEMRILLANQNLPNHEMFVRNLTQLSPILIKLTYTCLYANNNVLDGGIEWPKLQFLHMDRYTKPLDVLKKCPQLEKLQLDVNQVKCIFHNTDQTDEQAIQENFGNLPKLKQLILRKEWPGDNDEDFKIHAGSPLEEFLKGLLPQDAEITY